MKAAVFDLETSALEGIGAGMLLCGVVQPVGGRGRVFRLDEYKYRPNPKFGIFERQERDLIADLIDELKGYDLLIGHNIEGFDLGFLKTRAFRHQMFFPLHPFTYDTMKAFRRVKLRTVLNGFGKPSASLAMVADLLGVPQEKTALYPVEHWRTLWDNEEKRIEALDSLTDHCVRDVRMNARVYEMLLSYDEYGKIGRWH